MDKVTKNYDKDDNYTGKSVEKEQYNQDHWSGVYGDGPSSGHGGEGAGAVGCVIAIVAVIVVFLLFFIALIVGIGGNARDHWGFMLVLLKIIWWPIKTLFVIAWFLVKIPFIIADKITVPGLLLIALAGIIIAIISGNKKGPGKKKDKQEIMPSFDKDGKYTGIRKG